VKIRITGTRGETDAAVDALRGVLDVLEVSGFYPNRGDSQLGRVYVEAQARQEARS
jgi:hypothetical protein